MSQAELRLEASITKLNIILDIGAEMQKNVMILSLVTFI